MRYPFNFDFQFDIHIDSNTFADLVDKYEKRFLSHFNGQSSSLTVGGATLAKSMGSLLASVSIKIHQRF
jgi:hypothetical protein